MVHKSTTEADQGSILLYYFCSRNHSRMTLNYTDKYSCTSRKATATKLMIKKLFTIETHWWLYRLQNIESPQFRSTGIDMILQKIEATSQERSRGVLMHLFIEPINQDTHTHTKSILWCIFPFTINCQVSEAIYPIWTWPLSGHVNLRALSCNTPDSSSALYCKSIFCSSVMRGL